MNAKELHIWTVSQELRDPTLAPAMKLVRERVAPEILRDEAADKGRRDLARLNQRSLASGSYDPLAQMNKTNPFKEQARLTRNYMYFGADWFQ